MFGGEYVTGVAAVARSTTQRYERRNARGKEAAAILFREIRERVKLSDDLVEEIAQRCDAVSLPKPVIRRRGRGRAERPG